MATPICHQSDMIALCLRCGVLPVFIQAAVEDLPMSEHELGNLAWYSGEGTVTEHKKAAEVMARFECELCSMVAEHGSINNMRHCATKWNAEVACERRKMRTEEGG